MPKDSRKASDLPRSRRSVAGPAEFIAKIAPESMVHLLFNYLPGIDIAIDLFIKDRAGRFVWISDKRARTYGFDHASQMWGLHDRDLFPPRLAKRYGRDELRVLQSGEPLLGSLDLAFNSHRMLAWHVVNKFPVRNRRGTVIGLLGTVQEYRRMEDLPIQDSRLAGVVKHIQAHLSEPCALADLAAMTGISCRQLERRFRGAMGMTLKEFITRARVSEACRCLLNGNIAASRIALDVGFSDQSSMVRAFRRVLCMSPTEYCRANAEKGGHGHSQPGAQPRPIRG